MDKVLRYDVVEAASIDRLVAEVQLRISSGWQPSERPLLPERKPLPGHGVDRGVGEGPGSAG